MTQPIATEVSERRERLAGWLQTTYMAQVTTRHLAEDVQKEADGDVVRLLVDRVAADARRHEEVAKALLAAVGETPGRTREAGGVLTAKAREAINYLYALSDGTAGTWRDLHQLYLTSSNSTAAFTVAHRLAEDAGEAEVARLAARWWPRRAGSATRCSPPSPTRRRPPSSCGVRSEGPRSQARHRERRARSPAAPRRRRRATAARCDAGGGPSPAHDDPETLATGLHVR
jgi:hypothetical protein